MGKAKGSPNRAVNAAVHQEHADLAKITDTKWPESCPSKYEKNVLSIMCGNTHLHWGLHLGCDQSFSPTIFWRTPVLSSDEIATADPSSLLDRYLPPGGIELVFGAKDATTDRPQAIRAAAERRIPTLSIYVISTNRENEACIELLFRDIPCRIYRMKASDFFSPDEGSYEGIGIDRLSNLKAAEHFYKPPLIVFDGGTCMTYTATNAKGHVVGGGIYPGVHALHRCMHDYTGALPLIGHEQVKRVMDEAITEKKPMPIFATNTEGAMVVTALKAVSEICWGALESFKRIILADKEASKNSSDNNKDSNSNGENGNSNITNNNSSAGNNDSTMIDVDREKDDEDEDRLFTVVVTGGDGNIIAQLLEPDSSGLLDGPNRPASALDGIDIQKHKHLCHFGVQHVLRDKMKNFSMQGDDDKIRNEIRGQRIAKKFQIRNNESKTFRGSVAAIAAGKTLETDWFYVRYDDGDTEHLSITALYDALLLYREVGEEDPVATGTEQIQKKMEEAKTSATMLENTSESVKKHSETPLEERNENRKRAADSSSKSAPSSKVAKTKSFSKKVDPKSWVNQRVAKYFGDDLFFGSITHYVAGEDGENLWHVVYDDEDSEDYDHKDLRKALGLYKQKSSLDKISRVENAVEVGDDTEGVQIEAPSIPAAAAAAAAAADVEVPVAAAAAAAPGVPPVAAAPGVPPEAAGTP